MALRLKVNGEIVSAPDIAGPDMLISVLISVAVIQELVAIAVNDTIVPRAKWNNTLISDGDRLETVHFVGGDCSTSANSILAKLNEILD